MLVNLKNRIKHTDLKTNPKEMKVPKVKETPM